MNRYLVFAPSVGSVAVRVTDGSTVMLWATPLQVTLVGDRELPLLSESVSVAAAAPLFVVQVRGTITVPREADNHDVPGHGHGVAGACDVDGPRGRNPSGPVCPKRCLCIQVRVADGVAASGILADRLKVGPAETLEGLIGGSRKSRGSTARAYGGCLDAEVIGIWSE